jgi:putative oxidoreductase
MRERTAPMGLPRGEPLHPASARWAALQRATQALDGIPASLLLLVSRLAAAAVFLRSGLLKLDSWQVAVTLFRDEYKVPLLPPETAALVATTFEIGCPLLLIVGLATRLATLPLLGMTLVIQTFVYPEAWPEHLLWASALLWVLARGPGRLSLDGWIAHRFGRR